MARGTRRRARRRVHVPFRREVHQGARQALAPVRGAVVDATRLTVAALLLVALYQALSNAEPFARAVELPAKGIRWLADPTRSIAYAPDYQPS